jgi:ubiquinone/menaquinone biosynthesis C-methylase UbiE
MNSSPATGRLNSLVRKILQIPTLTKKVCEIILSKSISINTKMIRISELYYATHIIPHQPTTPTINKSGIMTRTYHSNIISKYIATYFSKTKTSTSTLSIMDIGGGNGNTLTNVGNALDIPANRLYCIEPKDGWEYPYSNDEHITYVFWDNKHIPKIKAHTIDVCIIMVTLHHMTDTQIHKVFENANRLLKPGSLLILKEQDIHTATDKVCIMWEHRLYAIITNPLATNENIEDIRNYHENYKSKKYFDDLLTSFGYSETTPIIPDVPFNTVANPSNIYWRVYISS